METPFTILKAQHKFRMYFKRHLNPLRNVSLFNKCNWDNCTSVCGDVPKTTWGSPVEGPRDLGSSGLWKDRDWNQQREQVQDQVGGPGRSFQAPLLRNRGHAGFSQSRGWCMMCCQPRSWPSLRSGTWGSHGAGHAQGTKLSYRDTGPQAKRSPRKPG